MSPEIENDAVHNEEILAQVASKQVALVYDNQPFALFSTFMVVAALQLIFLFSTNEVFILGGYLLLFSIVLSLRAFINWQYFVNRKKNAVDVSQAATWYMFGVVLTSLAWCSLIMSVFPILALDNQILLIIAVLGVVAAAHTTLGYVKSATLVHASFSLSALMYAIYLSDFPNTNSMLVAIPIYFIFVIRSSKIFYDLTFNMLLANEFALKREVDLELQTAEATSANNKKSEFLSRMSHELRTPLNAVLGMNELLMRDKKEPLSVKQLHRAEKVDAAGKHLLSIVDDVLDLSRIEAGRVEVRVDLVSCQDVINQSIRLVESKALKRNVTIRADFPDYIVHALADANRVKQILINLVDNAVKYNKHGGIVTVVLEVRPNNSVRISVIDTGYGIPEYSLDDLFRPFSRLGAEKLGIDGTGIGLNLCKQLIELMSGRIGVDSGNGKGCCFWIELPYSEPNEITSDNECVEASEIFSNKRKEKKILLVEDNLVNCEVAIDMLGSMGFDVDVVNDGQQALDTFDGESHALILMDCEMPVLDGFAATKKIREAEIQLNQPRIPIIALTAHAIMGARDKCTSSGMDDFLSKPFSMSALQLMLNRWLQSEREDELDHATDAIDEAQVMYPVEKTDHNNSNLLDETVINRLSSRKKNDGTTLLDTVVNVYLKQSSELLSSLIDATEQEDVESIKEILHALKSSSSNVGAIELSALCAQLESSCENRLVDKELIHQVHLTYSSVRLALNEKLQSMRE